MAANHCWLKIQHWHCNGNWKQHSLAVLSEQWFCPVELANPSSISSSKFTIESFRKGHKEQKNMTGTSSFESRWVGGCVWGGGGMERWTWKLGETFGSMWRQKNKTKTGHPLGYRSPGGSHSSGFLSLMEMSHFIDLAITMLSVTLNTWLPYLLE